MKQGERVLFAIDPLILTEIGVSDMNWLERKRNRTTSCLGKLFSLTAKKGWSWQGKF